MLERINHPAARRLEKWLWEHPKTTIFLGLCSLAFIFLPQWGNAVWYWFSADPPIPTIAKKMNWQWTLPTLHFSASWITGPIGVALLGAMIYLLFKGSRLTDDSVATTDSRKHENQGIVCLNVGVVPIVFKNGKVPMLVETEDSNTFDAAVAEFVNNPNAQDWVPTITFLEAQITYYDVNGKFCHRVTRCFWMNEAESYIEEFGPDVKGKLLIAVSVDGRIFVAENILSDESKDLYELVADSYRVQVYLSKGSGTFTFDLTCQPRLKLETALNRSSGGRS